MLQLFIGIRLQKNQDKTICFTKKVPYPFLNLKLLIKISEKIRTNQNNNRNILLKSIEKHRKFQINSKVKYNKKFKSKKVSPKIALFTIRGYAKLHINILK